MSGFKENVKTEFDLQNANNGESFTQNTRVSGVVLTLNSQKYLAKCLQSLAWCDEVVVVDSGSTDETRKIAQSFENVRFVSQEWLGFGRQKAFGVSQCQNEWVFVLDSDEVCTQELEREIAAVLGGLSQPRQTQSNSVLTNFASNASVVAFRVGRLNYFFGEPVRLMGLFPDYSVRLFNKKFANFNAAEVHEKVVANGEVGTLKNHFLHYAYDTPEQFEQKQQKYATLCTKKSLFKSLTSPVWSFFKMFVLRGGFLLGRRGFLISKGYAKYSFYKYR